MVEVQDVLLISEKYSAASVSVLSAETIVIVTFVE